MRMWLSLWYTGRSWGPERFNTLWMFPPLRNGRSMVISKPMLFHSTTQPFWVYIFVVFFWSISFLSPANQQFGEGKGKSKEGLLPCVCPLPCSSNRTYYMLNKSLLIGILASSQRKKVRLEKWIQQCMQAETDLANVLCLRFQLTARKDKEKTYHTFDITDNQKKKGLWKQWL